MGSNSSTAPAADSSSFEVGLERLRRIGMTPQDPPGHRALRRASVLVPLFRRSNSNDLHVLLNQRSMKLRTHAGEVCFPGGKQDPEDKNDDVVTALREAQEEVGLHPDHVQPICRLESLESYTGLCVTPVVGFVEPSHAAEPANLTVSQDEVEAAFAVPLPYFLDENNLTSKQEVEWRGGTFELRTYHYKDAECGRTFKIKGLTAYILHLVAQISVAGVDVNAIERPMTKGSSASDALEQQYNGE